MAGSNQVGQGPRRQPKGATANASPPRLLTPASGEILHRMGRETNQGEIAFEFDGRFYRIRDFDQE